MAKLDLGFSSIRELTSYVAGLATLYYGVVEAGADRQFIIITAGFALLGLPVVGSIFEKKEK
jgi:hypothetical protein